MSPTPATSIDSIVAALQTEIRRQRLSQGDNGGSEQPDLLSRVRQTQWVNPHVPIGWPDLPKGFLPKLAAYAKKIIRRLLRWYINPLVEQQNNYNAAVAEALNRLSAMVMDNKLLVQKVAEDNWQQMLTNQQALYDLECQALTDSLHRYSEQIKGLQDGLANTRTELMEHSWQAIRKHQQDDHLAEHQKLAEQLGVHGSVIQDALEPLRLRVQRLESRRQLPPLFASMNQSAKGAGHQAVLQPVDTYTIGVKYRNARRMAERLVDYDDIVQPLVASPGSARRFSAAVLDIGCGRGDLVDHLVKMGLPAYGIDIDADAVAVGKKAGLDIRSEEAAAHLQSLPDASLLAVFAIQVIEHMKLEELAQLFRLIMQKLAPNGLLVTETINPVCLWALSNHYLLDPTHIMPMHPQLTQELLEQAGFWRVKVRYLHPVPDEDRLGWVEVSTPDVPNIKYDTVMHTNIERLNTFLYGPQDYAAIAWKPEG